MSRVIAHVIPLQMALDQSVVDVTTSDDEVLAAGARKYLLLQNIGANIIYITVDGGTASSTTGLKLVAGGALEFTTAVPTGQIRGIAETATTKLVVVEG